MNPVVRIAAGLASRPIGFVAGRVQRAASGPQAILDVKVEAIQDTLRRQEFFHRLRRAGIDPNVAGVLLRLEGAPGGWAACQDLRQTIQVLRAAGRAVYAWVEAPGNKEMWIASACDKVFVVPIAEVSLVGVGVELTFFGAALSRLGVAPDFEAAGAYKSFGEPWTRSFASPENQEAVRHLVGDLQQQLLQDIAQGRGKSNEEIEQIVARAPLPAEEAQEVGLVDALMYQDQLEEWITQHHGSDSKLVPFDAWARRDHAIEWIDHWGDRGDQVAVLHLQGPIVLDEHGPNPVIAARKVVPLLEQLRKDEDVHAVVLHVNSPGGSVLASDLIWREVEQLRRAKPVVACFEDVAASGGYYLSAPASEIIARPGTLTGSIGVFGGKLVAGEGLRRMGVHTQEITASPNANLFSPSKPFTEAQRARFRGSLQRFYDGFVQRVAAGRRRPEEAIEPYCRGRVWTGAAARERGLVDRQGDLEDAVERARTLAGLRTGAFVRRDLTPHKRNPLARLVERTLREVVPIGAAGVLGQFRWLAGAIQRVVGPRMAPMIHVLVRHEGEPIAMLPFDIDVR